eukprot:jgi/Chlat1/2650/Chrsp178S02490
MHVGSRGNVVGVVAADHPTQAAADAAVEELRTISIGEHAADLQRVLDQLRTGGLGLACPQPALPTPQVILLGILDWLKLQQSTLSADVVGMLLGKDSPIKHLRCYHSAQVLQLVALIYSAILRNDRLPIVQAGDALHHMLDEMECAAAQVTELHCAKKTFVDSTTTRQEFAGQQAPVVAVSTKPAAEAHELHATPVQPAPFPTAERALQVLLFDFSALQVVPASARMSVVETLLARFHPFQHKCLLAVPEMQVASLKALRKLTRPYASMGATAAVEQLLAESLTSNKLGVFSEALDWLVENARAMTRTKLTRSCYFSNRLIHSLLHGDIYEACARTKLAQTAADLAVSGVLTDAQLRMLVTLVCMYLADASSRVNEAACSALSKLAPAAVCSIGMRAHATNSLWAVVPARGFLDEQNQLLSSSQTSMVSQVLLFLSRRGPQPRSREQRVILRPNQELSPTVGGPASDCCKSFNQTVSIQDLVRGAAAFCVASRLKTQFGGPMQTLAAVERLLLDVIEMQQSGRHPSSAGAPPRASSQLLPMRMLMDFVDVLEKHIYNAYEGSSFLPSASKAISTFFRTNRKVCEEWFSRIRTAAVQAGSAAYCDTATIRHALLKLEDMQVPDTAEHKARYVKDVKELLQLSARALLQLRDPDAMLGLQKWAQRNLASLVDVPQNVNVDWFDGTRLQAEGKQELAAQAYTRLLRDEQHLAAAGKEGVRFTVARLLETYAELSDWESLQAWTIELQSLRAQHASQPFAQALSASASNFDMNSVLALARFDSGDLPATRRLLELAPQSDAAAARHPPIALQQSEQQLLHALLDSSGGDVGSAAAMLKEHIHVQSLEGLHAVSPYLMQLACLEVADRKANRAMALTETVDQLAVSNEQDAALWLKYLRVQRACGNSKDDLARLHLQIARFARKQGNLQLATRLLAATSTTWLEPTNVSPDKLQALKLNGFHAVERARLLHAQGCHTEAVRCLLELLPAHAQLQQSPHQYIPVASQSPKEAAVLAKACRALAASLQQEPTVSGGSTLSAIFPSADTKATIPAPVLESVVRDALRSTAEIEPSAKGAAKSWRAWADWCYISVRFPASTVHGSLGVVDANRGHNLKPHSQLPSWQALFTSDEQAQIRQLVHRQDAESNDLIEQVFMLLQSAAARGFTRDMHPCVIVENELRQLLQLESSAVEYEHIVRQLVGLCRQIQERMLQAYAESIRGYCRYINLSHKAAGAPETMPVVLRVLRLLLSFGDDLHPLVGDEVHNIPLSVMDAIVPQLFAIARHPHPSVRAFSRQSLTRLAAASPHGVVYPALVQSEADARSTAYDSEASEILHAVVAELEADHPQLVADIRYLNAELARMTVLWEEQWLSVLQETQSDVGRRAATLREEIARVEESATLSTAEKFDIHRAKYAAVMAPVILVLERNLRLTAREPETPHERWFQQTFQGRLQAAVIAFRQPNNAMDPSNAWRPLKALCQELASNVVQTKVQLSDLSPALAGLQSVHVPMPALRVAQSTLGSGSSMPLLQGFSADVTILATKTKPKKLLLLGSDGQQYPCLLKGCEDLRLDQRIMQFLAMFSDMLCLDKQARARSLSARHYAVTPVSGRAGLIQWVENTTPLYEVYKAWQIRSWQPQAVSRQGAAADRLAPPRPMEQYYARIIPALREQGVQKAVSRKEWPRSVLRQVLEDLMQETPKQLLERELWCSSSDTVTWWHKQHRYARSAAVMSMIGYILGLGDRHLDNILLEASSGDLVHIDYNICFEKGLQLKVPEIVPFRLTHIMQGALGVTGVEGVFRVACERAMMVARQHAEGLLTLLEAFRWDPLLEWGMHGADGVLRGDERQGMELAVGLSLFASRVQEVTPAALLHNEMMQSALPAICVHMRGLLGVCIATERVVAHVMSGAAGMPPPQQQQQIVLGGRALQLACLDACDAINHAKRALEISTLTSDTLAMIEELVTVTRQVERTAYLHNLAREAAMQQRLLSKDISVLDTVLMDLQVAITKALGYLPTSILQSVDSTAGSVPAMAKVLEALRPVLQSVEQQIAAVEGTVRRAQGVCHGFLNLGRLAANEAQGLHQVHALNAAEGAQVLAGDKPLHHQGLDGFNRRHGGADRFKHSQSVLHRVQLKLEGMDIAPSSMVSVEEQVNYLIEQATSVDNLSQMYEGWTPWI